MVDVCYYTICNQNVYLHWQRLKIFFSELWLYNTHLQVIKSELWGWRYKQHRTNGLENLKDGCTMALTNILIIWQPWFWIVFLYCRYCFCSKWQIESLQSDVSNMTRGLMFSENKKFRDYSIHSKCLNTSMSNNNWIYIFLLIKFPFTDQISPE